MTSGIIDVGLSRDAPSTPWGFRLHGGKDIGYPLVIQRVFMGSPSEGNLQRGDMILRIQGRDTADMGHMDASDLIKAAGARLQLLIRRLPGAPQTPITPTSPLPTTPVGMHPYAKLLRETEPSRTLPIAPMFQPMSPPRVTPTPMRSTPLPPLSYNYAPLPTTPILDHGPGAGGFFVPNPRNLADAELIEYRKEKYQEKDAMYNQGYRTLPLIAPKPKTRHDIPTGSYLRHVPDSNWKGRSTIQPSLPKFYQNFPTPTYSTIGHHSRKPPARHPGAPTFERPLDDSSQLVHHQYNSPMYLYSQRNIDTTIKEQTGIAPTKPPKLTVGSPLPPGQSGPLSPGTPGNLAPARAGTKFTNIVDITLSPTFQMIQEEEKRTASPLPEERTPTLPRRAPGPSTSPKPPFLSEQERVNPFGIPKEVIHQSGSFKTLMTSLYAPIEEA